MRYHEPTASIALPASELLPKTAVVGLRSSVRPVGFTNNSIRRMVCSSGSAEKFFWERYLVAAKNRRSLYRLPRKSIMWFAARGVFRKCRCSLATCHLAAMRGPMRSHCEQSSTSLKILRAAPLP